MCVLMARETEQRKIQVIFRHWAKLGASGGVLIDLSCVKLQNIENLSPKPASHCPQQDPTANIGADQQLSYTSAWSSQHKSVGTIKHSLETH